MDSSLADQIVELALNLPRGKRQELIHRLEAEQPDLEQGVSLFEIPASNPKFASQAGISGSWDNRAEAPHQLDLLHHVAVQVDDVPRATAWYGERFACEIKYQDETWALLCFANFRLALVLPGQHPPHLAVCRSDAESFGELRRHRDGTRSVYTIDPWGNPIEILDSGSLSGE